MQMNVAFSSSEAREGAARTGMAIGMEAGYSRLVELLADSSTQSPPNEPDALTHH